MPARPLQYEIVDVFTATAFTGNPLAVVLDAGDLSTAAMQALAQEFNLSETVFPMASERADYRLRIFTPGVELPFAGHPSIGAAHTLLRLGRIAPGPVVQECGAGLLPLTVGLDEVVLTGGAATVGPGLDAAATAAALGLAPADVVGVPSVAGCGLEFGYLPVRPGAVAAVRPDAAAIAHLGLPGGLSVLCWDGPTSTVHTRMFAAGMGVDEDPATGSAALGLGVWLVGAGLLAADGVSTYTVHQGAEVGRPSELRCTVTARAGAVVTATVAGGVVPVASGTIRSPE